MKNLNEYIKNILQEEKIIGEVSPEENRRILLKYFNEYQFENEDELNRFLIAFSGKNSIDRFNFIYDFYARVDSNLVMRIDDEGYYIPSLQPYHSLLDGFFNDYIKGFAF